MTKIKEITKGCEHDGSYVPVSEVERLMQQTAIRFGEWIAKKCWVKANGNIWYNIAHDNPVTTAELFEIFNNETK